MRVKQVNAAAAGDRNERVGFGRFALELHGSEMHARQRADDLEMAEFLRPDVHQKIFSFRVVAIEPLDGVLHGGSQLAVGAAELLEQHVAELGIRTVDADREHQFLDVMVH
jgi:hypothetical protein